MILLRPANVTDAQSLTELAFRSKAAWGYDDAFMEACRSELTISADDASSGRIKVAEKAGHIAGFYQLSGAAPAGELADLFVDPNYFGLGIGKALWNEALAHAHRRGFETLEISADPHAENFYLHLGARRVGVRPSASIPGRELPLLRIDTL